MFTHIIWGPSMSGLGPGRLFITSTQVVVILVRGPYFEKQGCKQSDVLLAFRPPLHLQTRTKIVTQGKRQFLVQEAGCSVDCRLSGKAGLVGGDSSVAFLNEKVYFILIGLGQEQNV